MKVFTAAEMREVDRRTIEAGIPGIVLMESAAHRVVEFLAEKFAPLGAQRIVVLCGKGNNGGDGMAVARQLYTRFPAMQLRVVLFAAPDELKGDAAANYKMLGACGCQVHDRIPAESRNATLVIDALLGTGVSGPAEGRMLEGIREINGGFPLATVIAVDIPSGMPSDSGEAIGELASADYTITFTAPKLGQVLPPNCDHVGTLIVAPIGSPAELFAQAGLELLEPGMFRDLLLPRPPSGHKGTFGHALIVAGSRGKTGAAAMCGLAALRAGAGLVTVASEESALAAIGAHTPELMTESVENLDRIAENMTVIAMGPGLGQQMQMVRGAVRRFVQPMVLDADALVDGLHGEGRVRVLTPHPGEMARISGKSVTEIQQDRLGAAREFARERGVTLVLKGQRTVIAFADGRAWINPTGTPAMGTGGTGDVLTGMIAGFLAQFPRRPDEAVAAAVYLHGLAGQIGARALGEKCLIATDILKYLPAAMEECAKVPDSV
jgi:ADP-dependent NAD(P)H-hydrate dehydratase / NAD(P)H-hydrate epimerase